MIETPVKPPSLGGPPAAPPPDPFTRVMEPPPDPSSRYEFACRDCGAPLHGEQAACLVCGAMVEPADAGMGLRRAVAASAAAVLLLGGAVGAAIAGLPGGKRVPGKGPSEVIFGKKPATLPPATADNNSRAGTGKTTPSLGGASTAKKPPPINHNSATNSATSSNSSGGSGGTASSGSGGSPASSSKKKSAVKDRGKKTSGKKDLTPAPPKLFTTGIAPGDGGRFDSTGAHSSSNGTFRAIDYKANTAWTAKTTGIGMWIQTNSPPIRHLALISPTAGYQVSVYYTMSSSPPSQLADWKLVETKTAEKRQRFDLPAGDARNATYYLVWITGLSSNKPVKLAEIQLIQ